jgi:homoserine O-acetyltransferase
MRTALAAMKATFGFGATLAVMLWAPGMPASAHWPDQVPHQIANLGDLKLEGGGAIHNLRMSFVTHGKLNAAKDNAILFLHGLATNHHALDHFIGPGKPLDTDKYFIICADALGSTQTTFEHSTSPSNSGLKMKFPFYNGRDKVKAQYRLITETLGIPHLLAVTGSSTGADHSVQFAVSYPDFMDGIFPIVGGAMEGTQVGTRYRRLLTLLVRRTKSRGVSTASGVNSQP